MITNTKQNWQTGNTVKVGFITLMVLSVRAEKDGMPDIYTLCDTKTGKNLYEYIPYNGLHRIN